MLTADGVLEHYDALDPAITYYHHAAIIKDLVAYNRDDTLRYAVFVTDCQEVLLTGAAVLDPYETGADQIESLAEKLVERNVDKATLVYVVDHHLPHARVKRRDGQIGCLFDWIGDDDEQ